MIQIKKLKRPTKRSGKVLLPGGVSVWKKYGVRVENIGTHELRTDSVADKPKKKKSN